MNRFASVTRCVGPMILGIAVIVASSVSKADDWPQWMGANRDAKVTGFVAPATWPKELKKEWGVEIGDGVATPALVGNRLFVFARQGDSEVARCLDADNGKEIWQYKYAAQPSEQPSDSFPGPRSSPTVADGKVILYGVRGNLSCLDAATGKVLWEKAGESKDVLPDFFVSSSPIVGSGLCIVQRGGEKAGSTVAYNLSDGSKAWSWEGPGTAYSSPKMAKIGGIDVVIVESDESVAAMNVADGKLLWEMPYVVEGRGYNAATPIADGQKLILTGSNRGAKAMDLASNAGKLVAKELWSNADNSVQYNTPVLKDGFLFGLSASDVLFCVDAKTGKTTWSAPVRERAQADQSPPAGGRGGRGGRGGARPGYGSIVDAGSVLFVLTPAGELGVIEPNGEKLVRIANYKVADGQTYAYPVIDGNRIFIKDGESVTLYSLE